MQPTLSNGARIRNLVFTSIILSGFVATSARAAASILLNWHILNTRSIKSRVTNPPNANA